MSRKKKARSIKRLTGIKTGTKERTKIENKQRKASKKAADKSKIQRQRSVFQQFLDEKQIVDPDYSGRPQKPAKQDSALAEPVQVKPVKPTREPKEQSIWEQLERPQNTDTF